MNHKSKYIYLFLLILFFTLSLGVVYYRIDMTQDKRYTLTETTTKTLENLEDKVYVDVYLDGEFPASFKQLQREVKNLLLEFQNENSNVEFSFINPIEEQIPIDTLKNLGLQPSVLPDIKDGKISEILLYPYAVMHKKSGGNKIPIPLLSQKQEANPAEQVNNSIEELEYKFTSAIHKITSKKQKKIGFLTNHEELKPQQFMGFMNLFDDSYVVGPYFPKDTQSLNVSDIERMKQIDVLVVAKPRKRFLDEEKVALDQYLMNGGNLLWCVDAVNAEMDSLYRTDKILAYAYDLNLNDYFFSYGIRVNSTLVKDYQRNAPLRLVTGEIQGNPQFSNFQWSYFPLGIDEGTHSITKNVNPVKFEFASPIDILPTSGIKKTTLYKTSDYTTLKQVPSYVELEEIAQMNDSVITDRFLGSQNLAVLLEGKFNSVYKDRVESREIPNFKSETDKGKLIVISDGDVIKNAVFQGEPLPLGVDPLLNKTYGNAEFIKNCVEYLVDNSNLMELRNRTIELKPLNQQDIITEGNYWKRFNMLFPLLFFSVVGIIFYFVRRKLYA
ncbi:MAG: gliding motility-associated ABC transporter substrate-binding protein GldG [Flavobacteriales bacterium]|nr:gliding motility-associated ABC transporter substrate-binding protein GldG [Flavobacteriales bacterium]